MSEILDRGSLLFASLAALAVAFLESSLVIGGMPFYLPLFLLAAIYVPCTLLLGRLFGQSADYGTLLTCAALGWSASQIPVLVLGPMLETPVRLALLVAAFAYFLFLMFFAVRNIFGIGSGAAVGTVALSWLPLLAVPWIWAPIGFVLRWAASPFFIFYAWYFLGGELGSLGSGLRNRQHFHRMLEAAAINPHDGDAQYQLGLIYQQRRLYSEAIQRFQNAVAIDPTETDAHFQLGRIARRQGRPSDALKHFQTVAQQDARHSSSEILRELGAVELELGNPAEASHYLETYVERREYDPEGLYYYGQALEGLGKQEDARQMYRRAVEAARSAPRYRRRVVSQWSRLALKRLRG